MLTTVIVATLALTGEALRVTIPPKVAFMNTGKQCLSPDDAHYWEEKGISNCILKCSEITFCHGYLQMNASDICFLFSTIPSAQCFFGVCGTYWQKFVLT